MADILIGNIKGPQGIQGETGATGAPGANGANGAAATIRVGTVTTSAYGTTAQVINSGTESEAVFDFVIPQGKPGEETTRMSALTLDQVTASTATQPVPAVGESGAVIWGKVIKFFNDIKTAIVNKIAYDDCVANLTSTSSKLPLAANQGKALNDAIALQDLTTSITMTEGVTFTSRRLITFRTFAYFQMSLPSYTGGTINICTIPSGVRPAIVVALSLASERSADRTGRAEAFVSDNGKVYVTRDKASGPISITGVWRVGN